MRSGAKIQKNMLSGVVNQIITIAIGIIIPRLVIVSLGSEANGLVNSTNQAIVYLAFLEGGIGWTITQSLYKPVAEDNHEEINGIMSAANKFYKNVGLWYFVGLMVIAFTYTITIETTIPRATVFLVVILTGLPQVINFFFQGKYRTLISVNGYSYAITNLSTVIYIGQSITKILLLLSGFGLIAIQGMYCIVSILQMVYILYFVKKKFPWLNLSVKPLNHKIGQRSSVFIHQISGFIFSNSDLLVLTYFCDLLVVSVYTMYQMFFSMINTMVNNITNSLNFMMGQKFNTDRDGFLVIQNTYETINMILVFSCYSVLCACILPFLKIYTAGVTDINYIDPYLPYLFTGIQLLQCGRVSSQKVIEYAGEFKQTQWHSAVEMLLNVVISICGVKKWGIYGVLLGTIAALLFRSIMMIDYACRIILNSSQLKIYLKWFINLMLFIGLQVLIKQIHFEPSSYIMVIIYGAILMGVSIIAFSMAAVGYDSVSMRWLLRLVKSKVREAR